MKKKALGKGLSELIPEIEKEVALEEKSEQTDLVKYIPIENIFFSPLQPRLVFEEDESFEELIKSIKDKGILQPILVREKGAGFYECIAGERRLRAAQKLGLQKIPAIIKNLNDEEVLIVALVENIQRKNLNPLEEALGYKNLIEKFGYTQEEVAEKVGKERATIANLLRILKLPVAIQEDIKNGRLSVGHAKALLSLNSEEEQLKVRNLILKKELSVRETEKLIAKLKDKEKTSKPKKIDPNLVYLSEEISRLVGTKVEIKTRKKKTYFIFEFENLEKVENFIEYLKKLYNS